MRAKSRRRLDKFLIAGGGLLVGGAGLVGSIVGDEERITSNWIAAEVDGSGDGQIVEVIDYDFGGLAQDKHGIFRDVPGLAEDDPVEVDSPTAPDDVVLIPLVTPTPAPEGVELPEGLLADVPETRIRIGDENENVSGRHRYTIRYPLPDVAIDGAVNWNAVGTEWEVEMEDVEIHLAAPWEIVDPGCDTGTRGATGGCTAEQPEPGHLVVTIDSLPAGNAVTLTGLPGDDLGAAPSLPAPPGSAPTDDGAGLAVPAGLAGGIALIAAVPTSALVRRAGREQHWHGGAADAAFDMPPPPGAAGAEPGRIDEDDLHELATIEFAPPAELTPAHGSIILHETVQDDAKVAWLIEQAVNGAITLEDEDPKKAKLHWNGGSGTEDDTVLTKMFGGRSTVELGSYDKTFSSGWSRLDEHLESWREDSGLWDAAGDKRRRRAIGFGALGGLAGLALTFLAALAVGMGFTAAFPLLAVGAVVAGVSIALVVRSWELRVRTTRGTGLWLRVESFRRFIAESEGYHATWAAENGILREYTAWAVAVGEIDRWARSVKASPEAQRYDATGVRMAYAAPLLAASTSSAATAPSSSGGGGGFSGAGGGAGGGGGGSW